MKRDTYHDYVTAKEICNSAASSASGYIRAVMDIVLDRSGARQVTSSRVTCCHLPDALIYKIAVSFDSSAWTGRKA